MSDPEGFIQFECSWHSGAVYAADEVGPIAACRNRCMELGVVGVGSDGIGFGNVSTRFGEASGFIITGTQTGALATLAGRHFCHVWDFNIEQNSIECTGPIEPSSEALTHAAIYQECPDVLAIVHGHHRGFWDYYQPRMPRTSKAATHGSVRLAREVGEVARICSASDSEPQCVVLSGHQDGFLVYGANLEQLLQYLQGLLDALSPEVYKPQS